MIKAWTEEAWDDFLYWQKTDKNIYKRILNLIKDIERNGYVGIGNPEPLIGNYAGLWSRRITEKHRLVYKLEKDNTVKFYQMRNHYDDK